MNTINRLIIIASRIFPKILLKRINQLLIYAGMKTDARVYTGKILLFSVLLGALIITLESLLNQLGIIQVLIAAGVMLSTLGLSILYPYFIAERRAKSVEASLPDFFNVTASNMKSGETLMTAMLGAAKEGFGVLSEEVEDAVALSMGTESYERILDTLAKKIKSKILDRIMNLLATGIRTGGDISSLLEGAAEEVTEMFTLKKELVTSIRSYMLFIVIIIAVGLPFLLNISTFFVQTIKGLETKVTPSQLTPGVSASTIGVDFLTSISYLVISATCLFASMLIGSVIDESFVQGLKYFLPLLAISLIVLIVASNLVPSLMGSMSLG